MEDFSGQQSPSSSLAVSSPQSAAPRPAGPTTIKVSLDEVVIADRRANVELMTDGLSGCVAVALKSGDRIGLTHVYSDALGRFDDYKEPLKDFARNVANGGTITEAYLVHNGNVLEKGRDQTLPDMIRGSLAEQGLVRRGGFVELVDNGCTLSEQGLFGKHRDNADIFSRGGHTNSNLQHLDGDAAASLRGQISSGPLFVPSEHVRASGYLGPCELADAAIVSHPHARAALTDPPAPPKPAVDYSKLELGESVRRQLADLGVLKITEVRPAARAITETIKEQGFTEASLDASVNKQHLRVAGNGKVLEFDIEAGKVKLAASSSMPQVASSSSEIEPAKKPLTLFEQAVAALEPHREQLKLQNPDHARDAARDIASQANRDGLTGISRLDVATPEHGKPALVAHQDGVAAKQSQPIAIDSLQQSVGAVPRAPSQDGPDKNHGPIM